MLQNGGISSRNLLQIWVYLLQKQNFPAPQIAPISILAVAPLHQGCSVSFTALLTTRAEKPIQGIRNFGTSFVPNLII